MELTASQPPVVAMMATSSGGGYWEVARDGGVFSFGDAAFHGSMGGKYLAAPIVGAARTPNSGGYWLVASDGGIFTFGDAGFHGSMGGKPLNAPIVGMAATPSGGGYWLVASDGGIFTFGDAGFHGSMGATHLNAPVVGMAATPTGGGYWMVARDGGIFTFGGAAFHGSMGGRALTAPVVGMASNPSGGGYWMVGADGGIFTFGNAGYFGSMGGRPLHGPMVAMAPTPNGAGYWMVGADGGIFSFPVPVYPWGPAPPGTTISYSGGPVRHHAYLYLIFAGANWQTQDQDIQSAVTGVFYTPQLANWMRLAAQYRDSAGPAAASAQVMAAVIDPTALPSEIGPVSNQALVARVARAHGWNLADPSNQYIILPQAGISTGVINGCARHWPGYDPATGDSFDYSVVTHPLTRPDCVQAPNDRAAQRTFAVRATLEEVFEDVVDPVYSAWGATGSSPSGENEPVDLCTVYPMVTFGPYAEPYVYDAATRTCRVAP